MAYLVSKKATTVREGLRIVERSVPGLTCIILSADAQCSAPVVLKPEPKASLEDLPQLWRSRQPPAELPQSVTIRHPKAPFPKKR